MEDERCIIQTPSIKAALLRSVLDAWATGIIRTLRMYICTCREKKSKKTFVLIWIHGQALKSPRRRCCPSKARLENRRPYRCHINLHTICVCTIIPLQTSPNLSIEQFILRLTTPAPWHVTCDTPTIKNAKLFNHDINCVKYSKSSRNSTT